MYYGDCDARHKSTDFSKRYSFTGRTILIEAWMKELSFVYLEKIVATWRKFNTNCASRYSLNLGITERHVRNIFEVTFHFLTPGRLGWWKKPLPKNWKGSSNFYNFSLFFFLIHKLRLSAFWKIKNFLVIFLKNLKKWPFFFQLCRRMDNFREK